MHASPCNVELGLIELPRAPGTWVWAFTCPTPECACRTAIVLSLPSAPGDREMLLERGRPVSEAWLRAGNYAQAAHDLPGVTAFAVDLDTCELFPPIGDAPLDAGAHPEVHAFASRLDDDVLDAIARLWHLGKGEQPPPAPGEDGSTIAVEAWGPGDPVLWADAQSTLRADLYVLGERIFEALEHYCVEPDCDCGEVIVDFHSLVPRGAPHPGLVKLNATEARPHPEHERHRARLAQLWTAYCQRHPDHRERLHQRSATMHALAGRIVPA